MSSYTFREPLFYACLFHQDLPARWDALTRLDGVDCTATANPYIDLQNPSRHFPSSYQLHLYIGAESDTKIPCDLAGQGLTCVLLRVLLPDAWAE